MGPLWLVCQHLAKTVALHPFPQPCSHWLTAAKCFSPMSLFHRDHKQGGGDGDKGRCEAVGDRRDASTHQRLFWSSCANKEAFLVTPGHILTAQATLIGWDDRGRSKRACIDRISPLVSSKVNNRKRETEVHLCHTGCRWCMLADVLPCIKDKFLNFGGAGLLQSGAGCLRLLLK